MDRKRPGRRVALWALVVVALLAVGGWLGGRAALELWTRPAVGARFRHHMNATERKREAARLRPLPPSPTAPPTATATTAALDGGPAVTKPPPTPTHRVDPLLTALGEPEGALILEANAVWNDPLGHALVDCLKARDPDVRGALSESWKSFHFDPTRQVDRVAVTTDGTFVLSGFFKGVDFDTMFANRPRVPYGRAAVIYEPVPGAGGDSADQAAVAVWDHELWLIGDEARLEQTIDQLEGRAPRQPPVLEPDQTYGDLYGGLPGWAIANALRDVAPDLAARIRETIDGAALHLDDQGDLMIAANFYPTGRGSLPDLEHAIARALAAARIEARATGHPHAAALLDGARVVPRHDGFYVELDVPRKVAQAALEHCAIFGPADGDAGAEGQPATTPAASSAAP